MVSSLHNACIYVQEYVSKRLGCNAGKPRGQQVLYQREISKWGMRMMLPSILKVNLGSKLDNNMKPFKDTHFVIVEIYGFIFKKNYLNQLLPYTLLLLLGPKKKLFPGSPK